MFVALTGAFVRTRRFQEAKVLGVKSLCRRRSGASGSRSVFPAIFLSLFTTQGRFCGVMDKSCGRLEP